MNHSYKESFEKMRIAGSLAADTLDEITAYVKPGITTNKLDQICYEFIRDNGGYSAPLFYRGFPKSCCTSVNHVVCHGIPGEKYLRDGDSINIDVTEIELIPEEKLYNEVYTSNYGEKNIVFLKDIDVKDIYEIYSQSGYDPNLNKSYAFDVGYSSFIISDTDIFLKIICRF